MVADAQGNDLGAVGVPISGNLGVAPVLEANVIAPAAGAVLEIALPAAYRKLGLLKQDGGFNLTTEKDGDAIELYQEGYSLPSGLANATLAVTLAQTDDLVREVAWGKTPDENGYITVDAGGHATRYLLWSEEIFRNGILIRRLGVASVDSVQVDQSTRGEIRGYAITFKYQRSPYFENNHFGEWLINTNTADPETP
ncbi:MULTISPECIES: hypothetical protein [unclassified Microbacterium]|uniref:hypothetical protein n=1 Tax=unclassified Microbacterium TaxID=2609290 RepID=UPI00343921EC